MEPLGFICLATHKQALFQDIFHCRRSDITIYMTLRSYREEEFRRNAVHPIVGIRCYGEATRSSIDVLFQQGALAEQMALYTVGSWHQVSTCVSVDECPGKIDQIGPPARSRSNSDNIDINAPRWPKNMRCRRGITFSRRGIDNPTYCWCRYISGIRS